MTIGCVLPDVDMILFCFSSCLFSLAPACARAGHSDTDSVVDDDPVIADYLKVIKDDSAIEITLLEDIDV